MILSYIARIYPMKDFLKMRGFFSQEVRLNEFAQIYG